MTDNVIILGAGASFDAGIPLLAGFIEKMKWYALKGKNEQGPLSKEDKEVFQKAMNVMNELDGYHGRAAFDDRNIEDVLSILSFNIIGGKNQDKKKLNWMIDAISRTIDLSCRVKHNGQIDQLQGDSVDVYRVFWSSFFKLYENTSSAPTIITFNYDLVLERALFQRLIGVYDKCSFDGIILRYHYQGIKDQCYRIEDAQYFVQNLLDDDFHYEGGTQLRICGENELKKPIIIEILKLHGSLNFPKLIDNKNGAYQPPTNLVTNPFIVPPISNKSISNNIEGVWKSALERLNTAKNVVIVGYSMPRTDIYMQYFLKAALGPNRDLNKITVFDPELFKNSEKSREMEERYGGCFSAQLKNQIYFRPQYMESKYIKPGTFAHFVETISNTPEELFF
jgi:hypothetical protein